MGASVFEKHFTLNHNMPGPDHWFSADPNELIQWVKSIRTSYIMMGSGEVKPTKSEEVLKITARRSIFAISEIKEGDEFSMKNIGLRRPGNGLAPEYFDMVLGKKSTKYFKKGEMIQI
jgi:sialic acid synthase SpsE